MKRKNIPDDKIVDFNPFVVILKKAIWSFTIWGRNGFDGDFDVHGGMSSVCQLVNLAYINIIADDYNYAVAA